MTQEIIENSLASLLFSGRFGVSERFGVLLALERVLRLLSVFVISILSVVWGIQYAAIIAVMDPRGSSGSTSPLLVVSVLVVSSQKGSFLPRFFAISNVRFQAYGSHNSVAFKFILAAGDGIKR